MSKEKTETPTQPEVIKQLLRDPETGELVSDFTKFEKKQTRKEFLNNEIIR
jgi:hypothetical protein